MIDDIGELNWLLMGVRGNPYTGNWLPFDMKRLNPRASLGHASGGIMTGGFEDAEGEIDDDHVENKGDEGEEEEEEDHRPVKKRW